MGNNLNCHEKPRGKGPHIVMENWHDGPIRGVGDVQGDTKHSPDGVHDAEPLVMSPESPLDEDETDDDEEGDQSGGNDANPTLSAPLLKSMAAQTTFSMSRSRLNLENWDSNANGKISRHRREGIRIQEIDRDLIPFMEIDTNHTPRFIKVVYQSTLSGFGTCHEGTLLRRLVKPGSRRRERHRDHEYQQDFFLLSQFVLYFGCDKEAVIQQATRGDFCSVNILPVCNIESVGKAEVHERQQSKPATQRPSETEGKEGGHYEGVGGDAKEFQDEAWSNEFDIQLLSCRGKRARLRCKAFDAKTRDAWIETLLATRAEYGAKSIQLDGAKERSIPVTRPKGQNIRLEQAAKRSEELKPEVKHD